MNSARLTTLVRAGHTTCLSYLRTSTTTTQSLALPGTTTTQVPCLLVWIARFKSSAASLKSVGREEGFTDSNNEGKTQVREVKAKLNISPRNKKPISLMVIDGGKSHMKPLRTLEAPVLHHAHAKAMVDMYQYKTTQDVDTHNTTDAHNTITTAKTTTAINTNTTTSDTQEYHFTVNQLLTHSRNSLHTTTHHSHTQHKGVDEESVENSSVGSSKSKEPVLVGALPPDALAWHPKILDVTKLGNYYADLAKSRLTGLVVLTAIAGYAMAPAPLDVTTLLLSAMGTGLVSAAANSINQFLEVPFDSQMDRTKNRILVRGLLSPLHAISFACVCGTAGITMLHCGANGLAASLGALNLVLYTCVYTPTKRLTILNTWIGAIVGAIPPLIGWVSCVGELGAGAWVMAGILYAWQFPHFNSLSWNLRPDYSRAGYRMMSVTDPDLCRRVTLRYSLSMVGICTAAPLLDVTTWTFAADSLPFNGYLVYLAWKFYQDADSKSSRKLFMFSLIHLPVILMLMIISKKHYSRNKKTDPANTGTVSSESLGT